eukprot:m.203543 g.203543  ORF g.203543 m.203543 type:complete len:374 (+) comp15520_c2_seq6:69-1190(+)
MYSTTELPTPQSKFEDKEKICISYRSNWKVKEQNKEYKRTSFSYQSLALGLSRIALAVQRGIAAAAGHELVVRARLHHPALVQHHNHVGIADRRQAMSHDDGGAALARAVHGLLHQLLVDIVQRTRRLVEHDETDVVFAHKSARDGNALPLHRSEEEASGAHTLKHTHPPTTSHLAARETLPHLADSVVQPVRKRRHKVRGIGFGQRGPHPLLGAARQAVSHVLADGHVEETRLLLDAGHVVPQRVRVHRRDILPVHQNLAGIDIIHAHEQLQDGGLARARRADKGDALAGRQVQAEVFEDGNVRPRGVAEAHVAERDRPGWHLGGWQRVGNHGLKRLDEGAGVCGADDSFTALGEKSGIDADQDATEEHAVE